MKRAILFTDGGSRGNPGPAASGAVLKTAEGELVAEVSRYLGVATNNEAEYTALIIGMERAAKEGVMHLDVRMDSELIVRQMNGQYRVKKPELQKLFLEVQRLLNRFERVTFTHVRREKNIEADAVVNRTLDEAGKQGS